MPLGYDTSRTDTLYDDAVEILKKSKLMQALKLKAITSPYSVIVPEKHLSTGVKTMISNTLGRTLGPLGAFGAWVGLAGASAAKNLSTANEGIDQLIAGILKRPNAATNLVKGAAIEKVASDSTTGREEVRDIMRRIYNEDPSYWPYGLSITGHDAVYLIRDNMTKAAAGFVGWQQRRESGKLVGSYSIGILPEYRNKGFAKEAVAKIIREKAAGVDEVRSYVMPHNSRSKGLADTLHIPVTEKF